jgi:hypothetical protein
MLRGQRLSIQQPAAWRRLNGMGQTMKLDRNIVNNQGRNKYAVVSMRRVAKMKRDGSPETREAINNALAVLFSNGVLNYGDANTEDEFFVIMLKDRFADVAICAYAARAITEGGEFTEYGREVMDLALRAGIYSPFAKLPD